jgi:hypothetical protein
MQMYCFGCAEAEVEIGSLDKAEEYVNMIRNRAANPACWVYTYVDPNDPSKGFSNTPAAIILLNHILLLFQPGREFARKAVYERMLNCHGRPPFDLVRWGLVKQNKYLHSKRKTLRTYFNSVSFKTCNNYFTIPQS